MSYLINPIVSWLLTHAYGQGGTVAVPYTGPASIVPRGPFPPGVADVLDHVATEYLRERANPQDPVHWCFLVGGPGNGKSEALRELAGAVNFPLPAKSQGRPVPRVIPEDWEQGAYKLKSSHRVALVNDASIPRSDSHAISGPGSLFLDLEAAFRPPTSVAEPLGLLVNVNRGILVEEANLLAKSLPRYASGTGIPARQLLRWLVSPPSEAGQGEVLTESSISTLVAVTPRAPYYGLVQITLPAQKRTVKVHVVFLDALSPLEPIPVSNGKTIEFSSAGPKASEYQTLGSLLSADITRDQTATGVFVQNVADKKKWQEGDCRDPVTGQLCDAYGRCPFAQNAAWLQHGSLRHRFLDTLRGSEISGGKRFTYRELLEHLSLAILGRPESSWLSGAKPCEWVREKIQANSKQSATALVSHRIYSNLFSDSDSSSIAPTEAALAGDTVYGKLVELVRGGSSSARPSAFVKAFAVIDPSRDTSDWNGARSKLMDAVEALDIVGPSDASRGWPELPSEAVTDTERILDQVLREEIATDLLSGSKAATRRVRVLRRWRAILLLRQYGLACGHVTFGDAIQAWLAEQEAALRGAPRSKLGDGIYRLIMPAAPGKKLFLAPLRPRTYCLARTPANTVLAAISANELEVVVIAQGDALLAEVQVTRTRERQPPISLANLVVDLSIAREALLNADGLTPSFTEIGHTAFARIERARASLIGRALSAKSPVYFTDDAEKVYQLTPSPGGASSVRVQPEA